jgi:FdhD protein
MCRRYASTVAVETLRRAVARARVLAVRGGRARERADRLATEEPMQIRAGGPGQEPVDVAVTMRTPGGDFELAAGFLLTEGLIAGPGEVDGVAYCADGDEQRYNIVTVGLTRPFAMDHERNFYATSSCGVCGKASLEAVEVLCAPVPPGPAVTASALARLPGTLRAAQAAFTQTGGLHAAALFSAGGDLVVAREDVGRHNAVDKAVGWALLSGRLPLDDLVMMVSGRLSFEIVQKAAVAGCPVVAAVSAPSSLAIDLADRLGLTAIGFLRGTDFNVYTHPERVVLGR